jgi:hypothetical protein
VLITACGDDQRPVSSPAPENCTKLFFAADPFSFAGRGGFWGDALWAAPEHNVTDPSSMDNVDFLVIKFRSDNSGPITPGTYPLGSGINRTQRECTHCVTFMQDIWGDNISSLKFAAAGTIVLSEVNNETGEYKGYIKDVIFQEIEVTGFFEWGGYTDNPYCLSVDSVAFDTRASNNRPCRGQGGCPNNLLQACDPKTGLCTTERCSRDQGCAAGDTCIEQNPAYHMSACYERCDPSAGDNCGPGYECVPTWYSGARGICRRVPETAPGDWERCSPDNTTTSCGAGRICSNHAPYWHDNRCYPRCDYFADDPGCDGYCFLRFLDESEENTVWICGDGSCHKGGMCVPRENPPFCGDEADVGYACSPDHVDWICGVDEEGERLGVCVEDEDGVVCRRMCRTGYGDCPDGQSCYPYTLAEGTDRERVIDGIGYCK